MSPIPSTDYLRILPELVLTAFGMIVMLADPLLSPRSSRKPLGIVSFIGALIAAAVSIPFVPGYFGDAFFGMLHVDEFSVFFHFLIAIIAAVVILASYEYLDVQHIRHGEYYGLILLGTVGMMFMSSATELVLIFIALEISSIATYILAGFRRRVAISTESSLKYFLLGSFATAFFLYGIALMFGATGSTSIPVIAQQLRGGHAPFLAFVAIALMFVGIGFKLAASPFHVWTPDVYEGAPAPVVALMSTAPKAAAFAVLLRIFFEAGSPGWFWMVWISAALSMTIGNIGALVQNNVKRLLAYSSIAHAGYLLVAFLGPAEAHYQLGVSAAIFYTAAYAAMNVGAFCIVSHFAGAGERTVTLDDYAGLSRRAPWLAAMLAIFMLSLIGIPATGGFFAKFYVFNAALKANLVGITIIGVVNSAVASYYYLRVIVVMYMREPREGSAPLGAIPLSMRAAVAISAIATLYLGIWPNRVLDYALRGAQQLMR
jgi:NADH-quinone oxidoreductase subunit N